MMTNAMKMAGIVMTAAVLAAAVTPAQASGALPIYKACLAKAEKAPNPMAAKNQCVWDHWDRMAGFK